MALLSRGIAFFDFRMPGGVGVGSQRAQAQPAGFGVLNSVEGKLAERDQVRRPGHVFLHEIQQVRAAPDKAALRLLLLGRNGRLYAFGLGISKATHEVRW